MADDLIPRILPTLQSLTQWFAATNTPHTIIGGVAVSMLSKPRATRDVDAVVLVDEEAWSSFLASGIPFGFVARIQDPLQFALKSRVLLLVHQPSETEVDISLGAMPFERECISQAVVTRVAEVELRLPRVEDLIIMKAVASRPIDLADIDALFSVNPDVDRKYIRRWVRDFAEVLEAPEIMERLEQLLTSRKPPKGH